MCLLCNIWFNAEAPGLFPALRGKTSTSPCYQPWGASPGERPLHHPQPQPPWWQSNTKMQKQRKLGSRRSSPNVSCVASALSRVKELLSPDNRGHPPTGFQELQAPTLAFSRWPFRLHTCSSTTSLDLTRPRARLGRPKLPQQTEGEALSTELDTDTNWASEPQAKE